MGSPAGRLLPRLLGSERGPRAGPCSIASSHGALYYIEEMGSCILVASRHQQRSSASPAKVSHSQRPQDPALSTGNAPDGTTAAAAPPRVLALGVEELKAMLEAMERRHWNATIHARERGPEDRGDEDEAGAGARRPADDVAGIVASKHSMGI